MRSSYVNYYVLCLVCWVLLGITGVSTRSHSLVKRFDGIYTGPFFDSTVSTNITAQLGTDAFLPCKVRQLGNKSVSWIRRRDSHILSVNKIMFIPDERFQAKFVNTTDTWTLLVKFVQARDEGEYECQISTDPKKSHIVRLNIIVPKIEIIGDRDMYVKTGSTVAIRCVIKRSLEGPFYVSWHHEGDHVLNSQPGKIEILTNRINDDTISSLKISNVRREDSGNYTCSPSTLDSASVQLHVLNGEYPAAIQRSISSAAGGSPTLWWLAGLATLHSSHGRRRHLALFLLLIVVVLYTKKPSSYFATER